MLNTGIANHFIAFALLTIIRGKVVQALQKLCPAKLEGKDKGNLIAVITSDIKLLEVGSILRVHDLSHCDSVKQKQQYAKQNLLKREFSADHPDQIWARDPFFDINVRKTGLIQNPGVQMQILTVFHLNWLY